MTVGEAAERPRSSPASTLWTTATRRPRAPRFWLLALSLTVLAGGCGGATKFDDELTNTTSRLTTGTVAAIPRASAPTSAPATSTTTTRPATTSTPRRVLPSPNQATTTRASTTTVNAADQAILRAASGPPGAAAGIILRPAPATTLVVEVLEEPGAPANRASLDRVMSDLRRYSGKAVSEVHTALPAGSSSRQWTEPELGALADRSTKVSRSSGRFVLRLISVRGQNARGAGILAVSFRADTFATFPDRFSASGQQVITTVTVHELGHLLGLVDLYLDRGRADTQNDPAGGGHSRNPASVMYYAVDPSLLGNIFGSASDRFDAQDEQDMAAIRAGALPGSNPR